MTGFPWWSTVKPEPRRQPSIAILGAGGHGRDIGSILVAAGRQFTFRDDDHQGNGRGLLSTVVLEGEEFIVGVYDPFIRRRLARSTRGSGATAIHPTVVHVDSQYYPAGTVVGAGTILGPSVELGHEVHIGPGCTITRTKIGPYSTVAPGVHIAGGVEIGEACLIGVGAVVSNLITIGDGAVIGAGAVVVRDVAAGETVVTRALTATRDDEWVEKAERFAYGLRPPAK
jgi:UDP-3-O-[3-hydroxymyristoyl] glucosamine N-acyltransferase